MLGARVGPCYQATDLPEGPTCDAQSLLIAPAHAEPCDGPLQWAACCWAAIDAAPEATDLSRQPSIERPLAGAGDGESDLFDDAAEVWVLQGQGQRGWPFASNGTTWYPGARAPLLAHASSPDTDTRCAKQPLPMAIVLSPGSSVPPTPPSATEFAAATQGRILSAFAPPFSPLLASPRAACPTSPAAGTDFRPPSLIVFEGDESGDIIAPTPGAYTHMASKTVRTTKAAKSSAPGSRAVISKPKPSAASSARRYTQPRGRPPHDANHQPMVWDRSTGKWYSPTGAARMGAA